MNKNCEYTRVKSIVVLKEFKCSGCGDIFLIKTKIYFIIFNRYVPLFNGGEICDSCELQKDREDKIDLLFTFE